MAPLLHSFCAEREVYVRRQGPAHVEPGTWSCRRATGGVRPRHARRGRSTRTGLNAGGLVWFVRSQHGWRRHHSAAYPVTAWSELRSAAAWDAERL